MVDAFGLLQANLPTLLLLAGAALIVAEALAPGAHFFVAGVALFVAGLVGLVLPAALGSLNLLILAVVVIATSLATLYVYRELDMYSGPGEGRTSDSGSLRGQTGWVTEPVTPTGGEVKLENGGFSPHYRARTIDGEIPEGEEVMVMDPGGGNVVTVEVVGDLDDEIDRELAEGRESDPEAGSAT
jgi:membrane protein implicated in regulation of membrane protease activity